MSHPLSDRINSLPVSETLAMAAKARELRAEGKDIIGLSLGEPDFNTPDFIKDAAIEAINQNYNSYSPVDGYVELKEAICTKFKRDNDLTYKPSQIVVSTGAKQSIANVAQVLLNPGDEVILPTPYWVSYSYSVRSNLYRNSFINRNELQNYTSSIRSCHHTKNQNGVFQFSK